MAYTTSQLSAALIILQVLFVAQGVVPSSGVAVGGGGNGDLSKGPWAGGPEPGTLGLSYPAPWFQPTIDGAPKSQTLGSMDPVVDLSQSSVTGPGVYTSIGPLARTAKIYTYVANADAGGVGVLQTGMPTICPREDPFFGALEVAMSEDDDTYRVGVKFNNYIKVIKFANDNSIISEFKVNTLGLQDYNNRGATLACNSSCLPMHGCNSKTRGTGISTELWGLVAHANNAAVVIKVLDRVWFQLYSDDGTLLQNVNLNLWGYPQSNVLSEPGKLIYGYANYANAYSGGGFPYKVYFAYFHASEGGCDHQGEQLLIVDPTNWKACAAGRLNWKTATTATDVAVALAWAGSHSFARRLVKVKTGWSLGGDIIALAVLDYPYQRSPQYPGKGGIELLGPHNGQVASTYWFPDGYTQTLMGDWVYPEAGWNGSAALPEYLILGSYSQQYCPTYLTNGACGGFAAWFVIVRGNYVRDQLLVTLQQHTPLPSMLLGFEAYPNFPSLFRWTLTTSRWFTGSR